MPTEKIYNSVEKFDKAVDKLIKQAIIDDMLLTDYDIYKGLNISRTTYDRYKSDKDGYKGYREPIKKIEEYNNHWLINNGLNNPKQSAMSIFLLKQPRYGGFTDKPIIAAEKVEIIQKIEGCGENPFD